jgi:hypothetical protein
MNTKTLAAGICFLAAAALSGCARSEQKGMGGAPESAQEGVRASSHTFAFGGAGVKATSRVERLVRADGSEVLHGSTQVTTAGTAQPLVLVEDAEIDSSGRLSLATSELRAGPQGLETVRSVQLDAEHGTVTVRDAKGQRAWPVLADQPWIYAGLFTDVAPQAAGATAVSGWVARRAAQASSKVRAIDVSARESHTAPIDQVVFPDGRSLWVVLGDEAVEVDGDFIRSLPWKALDAAAAEHRAADLLCSPGPA